MKEVEGLTLYFRDFVHLLKEKAVAARSAYVSSTGEDRLFNEGRLMAFHDVVSLLQQQARAFDIALADLDLEDIDPERDLL